MAAISHSVYTAPVGLEGETNRRTFVRGVSAPSS